MIYHHYHELLISVRLGVLPRVKFDIYQKGNSRRAIQTAFWFSMVLIT
jgi:hypothetical protein